MSSRPEPRIGFLGAGQMATALAQGWLAAGVVSRERLRASDPAAAARDAFAHATGVPAIAANGPVVADSDVLVLAVKPQSMPAVAAELRPLLGPQHLVVSIAAGVSLRQLADSLGDHGRIVRVMPNTPCLVGACAAGYAAAAGATAADVALVDRLFNAVGRAFALPESLLDAVTGLSGSGPAFVYVMIEALSDGGVRVGLPRDVATVLAAQTVLGAAKMVLETGRHPGVLKDAVTSPGGTTIAGLHALERGGVRAALLDAVEAATRRAVELGKG
ncbi:MAG: pyrroline-5-carboxylate reductase [Gemmataceae bacterium]|nr:pyrroline-5-carboxylate reductase [Gemmataceae bacterium]MDW8266166.1 pyrroline-5-carboxylate reductase [Gemmataceae bacterium]